MYTDAWNSSGQLFSGQNGVVVSTYRMLTTDDETVELNDKCLQSPSKVS